MQEQSRRSCGRKRTISEEEIGPRRERTHGNEAARKRFLSGAVVNTQPFVQSTPEHYTPASSVPHKAILSG